MVFVIPYPEYYDSTICHMNNSWDAPENIVPNQRFNFLKYR